GSQADHEREAIAGRIPYLDVLDRSNDAAELHGAPQKILIRRIHDIVARCRVIQAVSISPGPAWLSIFEFWKAVKKGPVLLTRSRPSPHCVAGLRASNPVITNSTESNGSIESPFGKGTGLL